MNDEITCIFQNTWHQNDEDLTVVVESDDIQTDKEMTVVKITDIFDGDCFGYVFRSP